MPINILMPALSPTMEKGNLAKWHVKEGDKVASGDVIAEIETDKATMEVESIDDGTVARIIVAEGTSDVPVNELIAVLAGEGEDADAASAGLPAAVQTQEPSPPKSPHPEAPPQAASKGEVDKRGAAASSFEASPQSGSAPQDQAAGSVGSDKTIPTDAPPAKTNGHASGRILASPLARRLARENKLELSALQGSGPHGRIVQRDIEAALKSGAGKAAPAPAGAEAPRAPTSAPASAQAPAAPQGMSDATIRKLFEEGSYEAVPHDSMRKTIARRLVEAKTTIPHFYLTTDCRIDALLKLRAEINAAAPMTKGEKGEAPAYKLSVNDMVIKALALALKAVPEANVTWTSGEMLKHSRADIGVAVSIPGGLITPVVRRADEKTLSVISNEMKSLAARARARKLKPEEYQGGATAVSNLGMFGVKDFAAVINPPHATILAVGAGEERAIVEKGQIVVATMMSVTLSTDHRAVDGALGAELLAAFKRLIENPLGMLV
ncbi:MAG: pyruvate dehydrogenase complex dihydrolipoamide acetyltransferase [Rhizobiales bacterium]|nr:pyruvate dehydrogenase complex dihydrolipoamide acetyltransferase [Hyphomicrobiales bacterium]